VSHDARWGGACGRISALEERLIRRETLLAVIASPRPEDAIQLLAEGNLREAATAAPDEVPAAIDRAWLDLVRDLRAECPSNLPADLFLVQGDWLNLRNALAGTGFPPRFPTTLLPTPVLARVMSGDLSDLPPAFREVVDRIGTGEAIDPTGLDLALDGGYLRHLGELAREGGSRLAMAWAEDRALSRALVALLRLSRQDRPLKPALAWMLPLGPWSLRLQDLAASPDVAGWPALVGGPHGDLLAASLQAAPADPVPELDRVLDERGLALAREGAAQTAGPDRVLAFLAALELEARNLKIALGGRLHRADPAELRARLRST
jgi:vacuolar-type H+-ATPase subunit C/Vma6